MLQIDPSTYYDFNEEQTDPENDLRGKEAMAVSHKDPAGVGHELSGIQRAKDLASAQARKIPRLRNVPSRD